jgi:hypothetical protein
LRLTTPPVTTRQRKKPKGKRMKNKRIPLTEFTSFLELGTTRDNKTFSASGGGK